MATQKIKLTVNGCRYETELAPNVTLVKALREYLGLTGTNFGCGEGECGACTVLVNGKAIAGCLVPAVDVDGAEIETIEGQATDGVLSDIQESFVETGAIQCGFCTPGMIMSTKSLLERNTAPNDEDIKDALSGNLCRCTGYRKILDAVRRTVAKRSGN